MKPTTATRTILFVFRLIPLRLRRKFFTSAFRLFYLASSKHRLIALYNLTRAFPEKNMGDIIRIAKGVYRHFGIVVAEFFEIPSVTKENLNKWVEFEGLEIYRKAIAQNKGVLSVIAHFGNWELMTKVFPMVAQRINIIYRPMDNPILDDLMAWMRTLGGNALIAKEGAAKKIIRLLRHNEFIGILGDQNVAVNEGVFVDFFGHPACTSVGTAVFAMNSGAPVLPMFMPRMPNGKYRFIIKPPIEISITGDDEADILVNTQRCARAVEDIIRRYPDQWLWLHQRWKTKPWQKN
jgi:KDO2-lipid IV(A) lauroyltransferase